MCIVRMVQNYAQTFSMSMRLITQNILSLLQGSPSLEDTRYISACTILPSQIAIILLPLSLSLPPYPQVKMRLLESHLGYVGIISCFVTSHTAKRPKLWQQNIKRK